MLPAIISIVLAFYWLLWETDYLRIRLLIGAESSSDRTAGFEPENASLNLASAIPLLLTETCERTRLQKEWAEQVGTRYRHSDTWVYGTGYNTRRPASYQTMTIGNQTITLNATLPDLYEIIAEVTKAQTEKPRKASVKAATFQPNLIEQVRVGSHHEYIKWNHETNESETSNKPKKGYSHRVENDYATVYHDCLVPKSWLKKHEHDEYPEPTIELSIDGKSLSVNGNYKKGLIAGFMSEYTQKVRSGKKTMTIQKGSHVENCGGGVFIAVND